MFGEIVKAIIQNWRNRDRKDLIRTLVNLRKVMMICQERYDQYINSSFESRDEARFSWKRAVEGLVIAVGQVDQTLSIFSPVAHQHITSYLRDEMTEAEVGAVLGIAAMDLGTTSWLPENSDAMGQPFQAALIQLDNFIKENFKPEEIVAV